MSINPANARASMSGVRIWPDEKGWLPTDMPPASYGRATAERALGARVGWWQVTTPDGHVGALNPEVHSIIEHDDGTITVTPSIDMSQRHAGAWHGYLTTGEFRSC